VKFIFSLFLFLNLGLTYAAPDALIKVDLFLSSTCPHCQKADAFFRDMEQKKPWLMVHRYIINQDKSALDHLYTRLQQQRSMNFSVPAIFFCGSQWTGFKDIDTTGKALRHALVYCHQKIIQENELTPATINVLQKWGAASQLQLDKKMSRTVLTAVIGTALTDAINPCSLFCFAAFIAFLWLYPTRQGQLYIGGIFLVSLGFIHYLQQVHSAFYYQMVTHMRLFEAIIGLLLFLMVFNNYHKKPPKPTPLIFLFIPIVVLVVEMSQQICMNIALIFEQWLSEQQLSSISHFFYQLIYQGFYLLPLTLFWLIYRIRSSRFSHYEHLLKVSSYVVFISIGLLLIVYPPGLANLSISMAVLIGSLLIGWIIYKRQT
jgi:glutaredoxin